jgi:Mg/Co/Ni transporter MgtE
VPVLEQNENVVGFVTVDDVVDVLIEEGTEDILRMAGVEPGALDKPYFEQSHSAGGAQAHRLAFAAVCGRHADQRGAASL